MRLDMLWTLCITGIALYWRSLCHELVRSIGQLVIDCYCVKGDVNGRLLMLVHCRARCPEWLATEAVVVSEEVLEEVLLLCWWAPGQSTQLHELWSRLGSGGVGQLIG